MARLAALAALVPAFALVLNAAACSSAPPRATATGAPGSPVTVVASTDVYGDIAKAIGGDAVAVTSVIDQPDQDPHEYQASAQTQLALSKAQIVIENGAGYDDFVDTMLTAVGTRPTVITVADLSGHDQHPATGEFNEHVWYDLHTVAELVRQLSGDLATAAPARAAAVRANAAAFTAQLRALEKTEDGIKTRHAGVGVAVTEPVPLYLLEDAGLTNLTPPEFSEAVEEDTDVPPAVLSSTLALFDAHRVRLLAYNAQTAGPQTQAVIAAARHNGIAVVPFTETLPAGTTYLAWMGDNLSAVSAALGS